MRRLTSLGLILIIELFIFIQPVFSSSLVINEFLSHPSSGNDWIEIYNPTSNNIDLSSWTLVDSTSTMKTLSGTITSNGFTSFDVSNRLNNTGDNIYLKDSSGSTIDSYSYSTDPGTDKSIGRSPDGGNWTTLTSLSKGSSNGNGQSTAPTSTPTITNSPTPSQQTNSLSITNTPASVNSDQSFTVSVSLTDDSNKNFYLKGAFKKNDSSNYFGFTKVNGSWVKNGSSYTNQLSITTDSSGNWSGGLEVESDSEDSGFTGSGDYIFKVAKYNSAGSGPSWSNESTVHINETKTTNNDAVAQGSSKNPTTSIKITNTTEKPINKTNYNLSSSILGQSTASTSQATPLLEPIVEIKSEKHLSALPIIGGIFVLVGTSSLVYLILRNRVKSST